MVSALVPGASGPGSSPGRGHRVVLLGKTLTLTVPLSPQEYKWVPVNCWGNLTNCGGMACDGLASCPGGGKNTPSRFMLQKPGISSGSYGPLGSKCFIFFSFTRIKKTRWRPVKLTKRHL